MTFQCVFTVYGEPQGKARPRFTRTGRTYTPAKTKSYEDEIRTMAKGAMGSSEPLKTPVEVFLYVSYPVPPSYSKKRKEACLNGFERPTKKPDIDNILKAFCDAMNEIVYKDDAQVVCVRSTKRYGSSGYVDVLVREVLP